MKSKLFILLLITTIPFFSICQNETGTFTDTRDEKIYKTVKMGNQIWMAENLNYKASGSWCYDNNSSNCDTYGRLYTLEVAKNACPAGWHLPTIDEWKTLVSYHGGTKVAGGEMKTTRYWKSPNKGATNSSGFNTLPGGRRNSGGSFRQLNNDGYFWSATGASSSSSKAIGLYYNYADVNWFSNNNANAFSIRCVKD